MQFVPISKETTFSELSNIVGRVDLPTVLARNSLTPANNIGEQFDALCKTFSSRETVGTQKKLSILNTMVQDRDVFEKAALCDEEAWKVLDALGAFPDYLRVPETLVVPTFGPILGNKKPVDKSTISRVADSIRSGSSDRASLLSSPQPYSFPTSTPDRIVTHSQNVFEWFKIPWGTISLFSSISGESMDFPVYPEAPSDSRTANYNQMPDMLYQFEPWQLYQSSGPRSNTYKFHMHRDMWTGNHLDGKANDLIRFCESNCYADYDGSAVNTPTVTLYVAGQNLITGILTESHVDWDGPIGLDSWYLEFTLSLSITEVSQNPLNYKSVRKLPLIG